jgi:hypothetical protein
MPPGVCRGCGCTDNRPCETAFGEGCYWVAPDLCSNCVYYDEDGPWVLPAQERAGARRVT